MEIICQSWITSEEGDDGDLIPAVLRVERTDDDEVAVYVSKPEGTAVYLSRFWLGALIGELVSKGEDAA